MWQYYYNYALSLHVNVCAHLQKYLCPFISILSIKVSEIVLIVKQLIIEQATIRLVSLRVFKGS